jgi:glycosyltransferase involved in cell wall biosynthesis
MLTKTGLIPFTIIAVDYEHHVPRDGMRAGLQSLADQTFKDFELIIVHDGPKVIPYEDEVDFEAMGLDNVKIMNTAERMNNWGHSGRDLGMREASGEFFLQFNIDNKLYPHALETIFKAIEAEPEIAIFIFTVLHYKANGGLPFFGVPPAWCNIDCMQLVARRDVWRDVGFWWNLEPTGDGRIYEDMCSTRPWRHIGYDLVLGENY